eukprot:8115961-Alexandrium_andersonii.AAC.1
MRGARFGASYCLAEGSGPRRRRSACRPWEVEASTSEVDPSSSPPRVRAEARTWDLLFPGALRSRYFSLARER